MKRFLFAVAIASVAAGHLWVSSDAIAQPAAALGRPLPDGSMDAGSVSVRVVAGNPQAAVVGADVTLLVGGQPRVARTAADGRALFPGLTAGATVQAKIKDAEGKDQMSDPFPVPSSGGARVMLSTKPFAGGSGPAFPTAGAGGPGGPMPEALQMSGQPRADRNTPPATYAVRLTYNNLTMGSSGPTDSKPPVGETVNLVSYDYKDRVAVVSAKVDAQGHATFEGLDPSGGTGYFVLATLPRNGGLDRMFAPPVQMSGQTGYRLILSGEKRDSTNANVDALATRETVPTPTGKLRVTVEGYGTPNAPIRIMDAATGAVVASSRAAQMEGDPSTVKGGSTFTVNPSTPATTVDVYVHGGPGADGPLADVDVRIIAASAPTLAGDGAVKTAADGTVRLIAPVVTGPQRAVFKVLGREFVSEPFDVVKTGGKLDIRAQWSNAGRPQALLDVPYQPNQILYAEVTTDGDVAGTFRTMPFQTLPQTGTHVAIIVVPRLAMKFRLRASIEDQLLAVQGRWTLENNSWSPYKEEGDGLMIPLPKGHRAGVIADMYQNDVGVVPGEGFRIMRPLAPGSGTDFIGGFSMSIEDGRVDWALDLPLGSASIASGKLTGSEIQFRETPGMTVKIPEGVKGASRKGKDGGSYFLVENIAIPKNKSMRMTILGLPMQAAWKVWVPRVVGILVILTVLGGIGFALIGKRSVLTGAAARRAALLDELVQLERSGKDGKRKEQVMAELEKLWGP